MKEAVEYNADKVGLQIMVEIGETMMRKTERKGSASYFYNLTFRTPGLLVEWFL
jgi:hypothetical protein